jgi:hypothetical protein
MKYRAFFAALSMAFCKFGNAAMRVRQWADEKAQQYGRIS